MTPTELKALHRRANPAGHFFDRETMRFFGDTMLNYGVRRAKILTREYGVIDVWELYRKRSVKYGLKSSSYFGLGGQEVFSKNN